MQLIAQASMQIVISILSFIIAIFALIVSVYRYQLMARSVMRPVLVFTRKDKTWWIRNVGNGAAINLEIFDGGKSFAWVRRTICNPLVKEESYSLPWIKTGLTLGANYTDSDGRKYNTKCVSYQNSVEKGHFTSSLDGDYEYYVRCKS